MLKTVLFCGKRSTHNLKNLGAQATHGRSNYMAKVTLGGTINIQGTKKIVRINLAQLREPADSGSYPKGDCGGTDKCARPISEPSLTPQQEYLHPVLSARAVELKLNIVGVSCRVRSGNPDPDDRTRR